MKSEFWQRWGVLVTLILLFPLTILLPKFGIINPYIELVLKYIGINIILTVSLNLVNGYMGEFSVGHAGFMAIGAYAASLLTVWVFPRGLGPLLFPLALLAGGIAAGIAGLGIAVPSFRTRGDYLAIVTLAFNMIIKSVLENLELGSYRRGRANRARNLDHAITIFPRLKERLQQTAGTLSGGEQQMLAIGRGLMAEPKLLILDEPSLGLSPLLVEEMFGLIERIRADGPGILLVEQNVVQSLAIASRAYMLENGSIVMDGPAATLRDDPQLTKAYLGL